MNEMLQQGRLASVEPLAEASDIEITLVSDWRDFGRMAEMWDAFFDSSAQPHNVFQRYGFLESWARVYADRREPHILIGSRAGQIEAIVPLMRARWLGMNVLEFMGAPVAQFDDALIARTASPLLLAEIWNRIIASNADLVEARRLRADAAFRRILPAEHLVTATLQAPFARLDARVSGDEPGPAYSARERSNLRRRVRRLDASGQVTYRHAVAGEDNAVLAGQAVDLKRTWLSAKGIVSPTVGDERFRRFFTEAASRADSGLVASWIEVDGAPVAIDLSFDCKGRSFGHVLATELAYEQRSVGQLLIHHVLSASAQRGNQLFELMAPLDEYKRRHSDGLTQVENLVVPLSSKARLLAPTLYKHAMPAAKSIARRMPSGLVRRLIG